MTNWLELNCIHCGKLNFVDNGEIVLGSVDVESFRCWSCKKANGINGTDNGDFETTKDVEDGPWLDVGRKTCP